MVMLTVGSLNQTNATPYNYTINNTPSPALVYKLQVEITKKTTKYAEFIITCHTTRRYTQFLLKIFVVWWGRNQNE